MSDNEAARVRVIRAKLSDQEWRTLKAAAALQGQTLQEHASEKLRAADAEKVRRKGGGGRDRGS
jgi:hypothetical protein